MTDDRSLERAARSWLEDGPTQAPSRAVDAALLRIGSTPQERVLRIPWRLSTMTTTARVATAAVIGVLVIGGAFLALGRPGQPAVGVPAPSSTPTASPTTAPTTAPTPAASAAVDYHTLPGRILVEHLGNAPDGSDPASTDNNPDRRRLYFMDPADMTKATIKEFLPGQPPTGKIVADVSPDGKRVVFQDTAEQARIWEANLDGTGLRQLDVTCKTCLEGDPAYDPTGTKIAFAHVEGDQSWLAIRDLASGTITKLTTTVGPSADALPEQPSWSPDGTKLVFHRLTWPAGDRPTAGTLSILDIETGAITDLPTPSLIAGDADWSPDGSTIIFTNGPLTTASVQGLAHDIWSIKPDGTGLQQLTKDHGALSPTWTPDGQHILYFDNFFRLMNPDGSDDRPVNVTGMDLSDTNVGFSYAGHWVDNP